jgi:hypothetical protein
VVARLTGNTPVGIPTKSLLRSETHVGLHLKCPLLLSDLNQNWNVLTGF